jgi:hypothetical protein
MSEALPNPLTIAPLSVIADIRNLRIADDPTSKYNPGIYIRYTYKNQVSYTGCAYLHSTSRWTYYQSISEPRDKVTIKAYANIEANGIYLHDALYIRDHKLSLPSETQTIVGTLGTKLMAGSLENENTHTRLDFNNSCLTINTREPSRGTYGLCIADRDVLFESHTDLNTVSLIDTGLSICKKGKMGESLLCRGLCIKIGDSTRELGTVTQYSIDVTAEAGLSRNAKLSIGYALAPFDTERDNSYPESGITRHIITMAKDKVGIGIKTPTTRLDVNGLVRTKGIVLHALTEPPSNPVDGTIYFNATSHKLKIYHSGWHSLKDYC